MQKVMRHNAAYHLPMERLDVVVVEDSKQMQTILRSMLAAMRVMRVRTFESAEDALQAMLAEPPHVIITDWRMDPISGYRLLRSLRHRRMGPLCFVPVLMVTAHGTRELVEKALRGGAHHVLVKPLAPSSLLQKLEWISRDERKFCLDTENDFYAIEGVAEALTAQSERRQALDRARLHHARNGPAAMKEAENARAATNAAPPSPSQTPPVDEIDRVFGDLTPARAAAQKARGAGRERAAAAPSPGARGSQEAGGSRKARAPLAVGRPSSTDTTAPGGAGEKPQGAVPTPAPTSTPASTSTPAPVRGDQDFAVVRAPRARRRRPLS